MLRGEPRRGLAKSGVVILLLVCVVSVHGPAQTVQHDVDAVNQAILQAGARWTAGTTSVARLSDAERALRCGTIPTTVPKDQLMEIPVGVVPPMFDWRQWNGGDWTTPIRDQGNCGSCWDFSAIGVFDALLNIRAGNPALDLNLSEQYVLSCCQNCGSCDGGSPSRALEFCRTTGTVTEACLPYSAPTIPPCGSACPDTPQKLGAWRFIPADVAQIKQAIYTYGPVSATFEVYQDFFYYTSGVYEHVWGDSAGWHAISIVGWDDASAAWICKNSWGTDWGEAIGGQPNTPGAGNGGWFRIHWGNCSINDSVIVACLTSFPHGDVTVTVLDQSGDPIAGVDVYVDCGNWYGTTAVDGTITFSLDSGFSYDVAAVSSDVHLLLCGSVTSPGSLTLDCRTASLITVTARGVDGSPLEANLAFECDCSELLYPLWTAGGTGSFRITPGVYDFHVWGRSGADQYNLAMLNVDLSASRPLLISASVMPTARVALGQLPDFADLWYTGWLDGSGLCWAASFNLAEGDVICTAGTWDSQLALWTSYTSGTQWEYDDSDTYVLGTGTETVISAGGTLSLGTVPEFGSYFPGETVWIYTILYDSFGNSFERVWRYASSGAPTSSAALTGRGPTMRGDEGHPASLPQGTWTEYGPWLAVTPPTPPAIFDQETCLSCWEEVGLAADAELGTYAIHATEVTHLGTLAATSLFEVENPDTAAVFRVDANGRVLADGSFYGSGFHSGAADVAEWVPVLETVEPGAVLELDSGHPGCYRATQTPCSHLVGGIVSSDPGVTLGGSGASEGMELLALSGIVPVKVTDEGGPIQPGDLLVSSSTPGYAMRWAGGGSCPCALVGKALEPMTDERGVISVLLTAH